MASFREVRELLERYYCWRLTQNPARRAEHLLFEVRARLRQMEWAHGRMLAIEADLEAQSHRSLPADQPPPDRVLLVYTDTDRPDCKTFHHANLPAQPADELHVLLEAYYYSAHRVRDILKDNRDDLPGPSSFEAAGVRNVRNHLTRHSRNQSPQSMLMFVRPSSW